MAEHTPHARHDRFAIAEALGGGVVPSTVRTCPACGALHVDLLSIQSALRHAWTPPRPRDLRLTIADVARLKPALWRRVLGIIGSAQDAITRPLGIAFTSLGIGGLLLTALPLGIGAGMATTPVSEYAIRAEQTPGMPSDTTGDATAPPLTTPSPDLLLLASVGSLGAGGAIFVLRRVASRTRGVR